MLEHNQRDINRIDPYALRFMPAVQIILHSNAQLVEAKRNVIRMVLGVGSFVLVVLIVVMVRLGSDITQEIQRMP